MAIHDNEIRVGNFNSSKIVALTKMNKSNNGFGEAAKTFIDKKNYERRLGRTISNESNARPLSWGKLCEGIAFERLGLEYSISSQETDMHPTIPYWVGSKDGLKHDEGKTVIDIKCPMTLESFCDLVQGLYNGLVGMAAMDWARNSHKEGDTYYWQIVSNSIINNCKYGELIVFMPYKSEIDEIKLMADGDPNLYWLSMANENELPFLLDGGYYKNLNVIRFEIPKSDIEFLTHNVLEAGKFLVEPFKK
jgi:hypothetical protein